MARTCSLLTILLFLLLLGADAQAQIVIRDIIPNTMSDETEANVEPFIVFNPADPRILVVSSGMFALPGSSLGPLLVSLDGGATWNRRDVIPTCMGCLNTGDTTMGYNASGRFFAGILSLAVGGQSILTSTDPTFTTALTQISNTSPRDQPYIQTSTVFGWFDPNVDRAYVAAQTASGTSTARIDQVLDAGIAAPVTQTFNIDARMPLVFDNYYVRPLIHPDGTLYTAFVRHLSSAGAGAVNAELVVRRDDTWARTAPEYQAISGANGVTVASYQLSLDFGTSFAGERHAGDLAMAVDPQNSHLVYLSYASRTSAAQPIALHLVRSIDGGMTWSADLLTVQNAKNSSIAVNSQGHLAYLYQAVTGASGSRHWVTHLRRSNDGTVWSDDTLSDFPGEGAGAPPHPLGPYIADYDRVISIGKNFFGTFSASNDPATLPAGTNFLRNVSGGAIVGGDGVTPVAISIDPFFFRTTEMAADLDLYVRDWTDSSAVRDHGLEPSARNAFYVTSDVWNRRSNDPQPFDGNDRPQQQDPRPVAFGHNWAFARVSREATGSSQNPSLEFLFSDGGVGTNYVSAGTTSLSLGSGATDVTATVGNGFQWDLPSGASNHVCLAVQVTTPGDPLLGMSLVGRSPGWPNTDLEVLNDNNKAQRNMNVHFGLAQTSDWAATAVIHNAAESTRDMQIGVDFDLGDIEGLLRPRIRFIGGARDQRDEWIEVKPRGLYTLKDMRPGESRWIELAADAGEIRDDATILIYEIVRALPLNGYGFIFHPAKLDEAIADNLAQHGAVMARLAHYRHPGAKAELERTRKLLEARRVSTDQYVKFVRRSLAVLQRGVTLPGSKNPVRDPFGIVSGLKKVLGTGNVEQLATSHRSLLNRVDALISMNVKQGGDLADVAQMIRAQRERAAGGRYTDAELVKLSDAFLQKPSDYAAAVREMLPRLKKIASASGDHLLLARYTALASARGTQAVQGAHRDFLWRLEEVGK